MLLENHIWAGEVKGYISRSHNLEQGSLEHQNTTSTAWSAARSRSQAHPPSLAWWCGGDKKTSRQNYRVGAGGSGCVEGGVWSIGEARLPGKIWGRGCLAYIRKPGFSFHALSPMTPAELGVFFIRRRQPALGEGRRHLPHHALGVAQTGKIPPTAPHKVTCIPES